MPFQRCVFILFLSLPLLLADVSRAETVLGITFDGKLYSISTIDASSTLIGEGVYTGIVGGLEYDGATGDLLAISAAIDSPTSLYRVDSTTGIATEIGPTQMNSVFEGALQFSPGGDLYATNGYVSAGSDVELLMRLDPSTGAVLSSTAFSADVDINGLAWFGNQLIGLEARGNDLVTIDPNTATVSLLAELPRTAGSIGGMTNGPEGTGYFTASGDLYSFDLQSGQATSIGSTGLFLAGLAAAPTAIPEPSSLALMAACLVPIFFRARRSGMWTRQDRRSTLDFEF